MLCLLIFSSPGNAVNLPVVDGPNWRGLTHWRGIVWDPGIIGMPHLRLCCDCLRLIALFRDVPLFVRGQTDSSAWFQKDIGDWRTIACELGSLGRDHPSCYAALSLCLDVWQIKGLKPKISDIIGRLQQLVREPVPKTLEQMLRSLLDGQRQRQQQSPRQ